MDLQELTRILCHLKHQPRDVGAEDTAEGTAEILLICGACHRTVRRQPVSGSRSFKVPVRCTPCAESIEDSELALALKALRRAHPKDQKTGRFLEPKEYSLFVAAVDAYEAARDSRYARLDSDDPVNQKTGEEVLRFLREWLNLEMHGQVKKVLKSYEIDSDPFIYYYRAFFDVMRWASEQDFRTAEQKAQGKTNWFSDNDEALGYILESIQSKARQFAEEDGYRSRDLGLESYGLDPDKIDLGGQASLVQDKETRVPHGTKRLPAKPPDTITKEEESGKHPLRKQLPQQRLLDPAERDLYWNSRRLQSEDAERALARAKEIVKPKQAEVLELVAKGLPYRAIGEKLGIGKSTVGERYNAARTTIWKAGLSRELGYGERKKPSEETPGEPG